MTYDDGQLQPRSEPGARFAALVDEHAPVFRERAAQHDRDSTFPVENIAELQASGGIAAFVPEELGGLGLQSLHDWIVAIERLGRGDASTAIALNMHLSATRALADVWRRAVADGDQAAAAAQAATLQAVVAGDLVIAGTSTEQGADFLRPESTAVPSEDGYVLNGRKFFVTMSPAAQLFVINLRVPGEADEPDRFGFAFVPADTPGCETQDDWDALGMRASGSSSLVLNNCRIPASALRIAGEVGHWNPGVLMGRTTGNITLVGVFLGIAERAHELALEAAQRQTKTKLGGPIAASTGIQHLIGQIEIDLHAARAILANAALRLESALAETAPRPPDLETGHALMRDYQCAKWVVNQNAIAIVSRAMDVAGGGAFMAANELSRLYRDVRAGPFMQPFTPTETHEYIGQVALGRYPQG